MATYGVSPREEVASAAADTTAVWLDVRSTAEQEQNPLPKVRARRVGVHSETHNFNAKRFLPSFWGDITVRCEL
jgi:hypothetical protein